MIYSILCWFCFCYLFASISTRNNKLQIIITQLNIAMEHGQLPVCCFPRMYSCGWPLVVLNGFVALATLGYSTSINYKGTIFNRYMFHVPVTLWQFNISMEHHHISWENSLFLWPCSKYNSKLLVITRG